MIKHGYGGISPEEDIACVAALLYGNAAPKPFRTPKRGDVLVVHVGAHIRNGEMMARVVAGLLRHVVLGFPGPRYWLEPFPQHFPGAGFLTSENAILSNTTVHNITEGIVRRGGCPALSNESRTMQMDNRVTVLREALDELEKDNGTHVCLVQSFEALALMHKDHPGAAHHGDCTHYGPSGYMRAWRSFTQSRARCNLG